MPRSPLFLSLSLPFFEPSVARPLNGYKSGGRREPRATVTYGETGGSVSPPRRRKGRAHIHSHHCTQVRGFYVFLITASHLSRNRFSSLRHSIHFECVYCRPSCMTGFHGPTLTTTMSTFLTRPSRTARHRRDARPNLALAAVGSRLMITSGFANDGKKRERH